MNVRNAGNVGNVCLVTLSFWLVGLSIIYQGIHADNRQLTLFFDPRTIASIPFQGSKNWQRVRIVSQESDHRVCRDFWSDCPTLFFFSVSVHVWVRGVSWSPAIQSRNQRAHQSHAAGRIFCALFRCGPCRPTAVTPHPLEPSPGGHNSEK